MTPRHTVWGATVTRADGEVLRPDIKDGRLDWGIDRDHIAGGSLTTTSDIGNLIGATVEPFAVINGNRHEFGPFIATANPAKLSISPTQTVEFIDPTIIMSRALLQQPLSLPRATPVVPTARQRAAQLGLQVAIPDSDITLRVALAFDRRTPEMKVMTTLLSAAQLSKVRARPSGLVVERLVAPDELPETWELVEGPQSVQVLNYGFDSDYLAVPNRIQIETRGDAQATPLIGTARDEATSRWSFQARKHWFDVSEALTSEVTTQEAVNQEARRELLERMTRAEKATVHHAWAPEYEVGSVGQLGSQRFPSLNGTWQIESQQLQMSATALASSTLRRVIRL